MELEFSGITSAELVNWIESHEIVVLIDCRSSLEYGTSHIVDAVSIGGSRAHRREIMNGKVCLPEILQQKWALLQEEKLGLPSPDIGHTQTSDQITLKNKLESNVKIVIYDQNSIVVSNQHSLIYQVLMNLKSEFSNISFLKGGFMGFQSQHPTHCWTSEHKQPDEDFVPHHQHKHNFHLSYSSMDVTSSHNPLVSSSANSSTNNSRSSSKLHLELDFGYIPGPSSSKIVKSLSSHPRRRPEQLPSLSSALPGPSISQPLYPGSLSGPALSLMPYGDSPSLSASSRDCCGSRSGTSRVPTPVLSHLILGSQQDALSEQLLQEFGITHIINVSTDGLQSPFIPSENFLRIPILDNFCDTITNHFPVAFEFLDKVKSSGGRALVHCSAGISRSPTIAIAYLMKMNSISVTEAYEIVKSIRPSISPNFNFMGQLTAYESELSASQAPSTLLKSSPSLPKLSSKKKHKSSLPSCSTTAGDSHTRPKRRPSRLGFFSSLVRPSYKGPLLPSPSRPFSNLGLNSPTPSSPPHKLLLTSLTSSPRQYASHGVKVKRNPAPTGDPHTLPDTGQHITSSSSSCALKRRLISLYSTPSTNTPTEIPATTTTTFSNYDASSSSMLSSDVVLAESPSTPPPPYRSLSIDRIDKQNQQQSQIDSSGAGVLTDSCRLQETHQSTSSLSSANSHSSSLLAN